MSPVQRQQRRAASAMAAGVMAIVVLIASVWMVGVQAANGVRASEGRARAVQSQQLRAGCARGVARDFESLGTNRDLRDFARDAARARRADGNVAVARRYDVRADSAAFRMRRIRLRIPARENDAAVAVFCRDLYPDPVPKGG